ncbi:MAG: radical SAM family heme chaperone HemW [Paludibacteraceae bacterium]|nr:radical SAM family heme chaperone HemW [Paludibacteraceae bacterium]
MAGIYIHIPFCKSRCKYCDFFSTTHLEKQAQYVQALLVEIQDRLSISNSQYPITNTQYPIPNNQYPISTIYIGGGTPSTLQVEHLRAIVEAIRREAKGVRQEITLEANPGDITQEKARAWREMGINRLSIGIQSFEDELLQLIGRRHNAEQARQAVTIAQAAGFDNISIDLMYALPSQTMQQWQHDVAQALQLNVQHISTYGLIYEEGTALTTLLDHGVVEAVDEETEMQMYDYLVEQLTANGYIHYEVSNFALPNCESKHNSSYWNDTPYIGLGAGAHSYNGQQRQWNISDLDTYIQQANAHQLQPQIEQLTDEQRHIERIMLGLRTRHGVAANEIPMHKAQGYINRGLLSAQGNRIVATTQGYHILNTIIEDLLT